MIRSYLVYFSQKIGLYQWAVKQDTLRKERKLKKAFNKYGLETLQQADKAFRSEGCFIFPTFGTLYPSRQRPRCRLFVRAATTQHGRTFKQIRIPARKTILHQRDWQGY